MNKVKLNKTSKASKIVRSQRSEKSSLLSNYSSESMTEEALLQGKLEESTKDYGKFQRMPIFFFPLKQQCR